MATQALCLPLIHLGEPHVPSEGCVVGLRFILLLLLLIFMYLAAPDLICSMWDLIPGPEVEARPPALGAWSPSHTGPLGKSSGLKFK